MSDEQPLPPLPPQDPVVLPYAQAGVERPGILTALGVLSVVIGGLSTLTNLCGIFQSITFLVMTSLTSAITTAPTTGPGNPFADLPATPLILKAILGLANSALAIYLIVCGAIVLRNRVAGRKHHVRYAILKFALAVPAAAVEAWSTYSTQSAFMASMPPPTPTPVGPGASVAFVSTAALTMTLAMAGFWLVISLAYPTAVLIVMHLKQVKAYYTQLTEVGRY